jgi:SAM-dependent methyltransferase
MSLRARLALVLLGFFTWFTWSRFKGAPWVPTPRRVVRRMLALGGVKPGELVYDLGSGDGRVLTIAARQFGARAVGIEIDPLRCIWSRVVILLTGLREKARVVRGDLFDQDLSPADVVTCYLLQGTNDRLAEKLGRELRPGARVVSNSFTFPGLTLASEDEKHNLYLYTKGEGG